LTIRVYYGDLSIFIKEREMAQENNTQGFMSDLLGGLFDLLGDANQAIVVGNFLPPGEDAGTDNQNAWDIARAPDSTQQELNLALSLSFRSIRLLIMHIANYLDTLAAVYYSQGEFDKVRLVTSEALRLIKFSGGFPGLENQLKGRLETIPPA